MVLPAVAFADLGGKILLVACPFPVKNVTVSISRFYQFSITIALRFSAKKDNFRIGGKEKMIVMGKPCGGRDKGSKERKGSRNCPGCPCAFCGQSEKVIIFDMLHNILNITVQDIA